MLGAISIGEFEVPAGSNSNKPPEQADLGMSARCNRESDDSETKGSLRTLVAIVHRPRTVMIQDIDSGQRCFVKLGKMPPAEHVSSCIVHVHVREIDCICCSVTRYKQYIFSLAHVY
jgi:hypothetical protein